MALNLIRYQLSNRTQKWSFRSVVENVKRQTRTLFRRICKKGSNKDVVDSIPIYRSPNAVECLKSSERRLFSFFRRASEWSREALVSALCRRSGHRVFCGSSGAAVSFVGFALSTRSSLLTEQEEMEGLSFAIRETFSKVPVEAIYPHDSDDLPSVSLNDLEIGSLLAKGCNAVVYSACWKHTERDVHEEPVTTDVSETFSPFDLAVKVMFNYSAQSDAMTIWRAMFKEALPALQGLPLTNIMGIKNRIPPHPNIVKMYCAFADEMPLLPDALSHYPQALPLRLTKHGYGRNMTLFLVMKRYHCSLKEYLIDHPPSVHTSLSLFCQLLEALVHLLQHGFVHRDLKTDNVLLDLSHGISNPILAITDFGCCHEGMKLPYTTEEIDRGGNLALMAPEVATAEAGPFSVIDYSRSDLWTLGTMAYEIFGAKNPFYVSEEGYLEASTYSESELPPLPPTTPELIQKLIKDMLHRDPKMRPPPALAATICQLLLHAPSDLLHDALGEKSSKKIVHWMFQMSACTFLEAVMKPCKSRSLEFQLRYTFCRRIQFLELLQALQYMSQI